MTTFKTEVVEGECEWMACPCWPVMAVTASLVIHIYAIIHRSRRSLKGTGQAECSRGGLKSWGNHEVVSASDD